MKTVELASEYNVKFGGIPPPPFPLLIILNPASTLRNSHEKQIFLLGPCHTLGLGLNPYYFARNSSGILSIGFICVIKQQKLF